jgi:hypothetical protein
MILAVSGRLGDRLGSLGTKQTSFWASGRPKTLLHTHKDAPLPSFVPRTVAGVLMLPLPLGAIAKRLFSA